MIGNDWNRATVNKHVGRIKRLFKWAVSEDLLHVTVYGALATVTGLRQGRTSAPEPVPVKPVPDAYVDAIQDHVAPAVWAMVQLHRLSGMRSAEVTIMRNCDLDMSGPVWEYRPTTHKTEHHDHDTVIYLGPRC